MAKSLPLENSPSQRTITVGEIKLCVSLSAIALTRGSPGVSQVFLSRV